MSDNIIGERVDNIGLDTTEEETGEEQVQDEQGTYGADGPVPLVTVRRDGNMVILSTPSSEGALYPEDAVELARDLLNVGLDVLNNPEQIPLWDALGISEADFAQLVERVESESADEPTSP